MGFFTVPTLTGRVLFVLVLLAHQRRRIIHVNITDHPTAAWTAQETMWLLDLHRVALSSVTSRRFQPAHESRANLTT